MLASIVLGVVIGGVKFLFEDIIGFSLIILFPLLYGIALGFVLARIFSYFGLKKENLSVVFAILSITIAITTFLFLDYSYVQNIVLETLAAEGEDVTDLYLTIPGYFQIIGDTGTSIGYIVGPGLGITGMWFYLLKVVELGLMYYYAVKKVREFHPKHTEQTSI